MEMGAKKKKMETLSRSKGVGRGFYLSRDQKGGKVDSSVDWGEKLKRYD